MSDDLVKRLRNTPNWMREGFQDWKDNVRTYDRAPFEAADRIEELEAKLAKVVEAADAMAVAIEGQIGVYDASEDEVVALHNYCTTLTELKRQDDE